MTTIRPPGRPERRRRPINRVKCAGCGEPLHRPYDGLPLHLPDCRYDYRHHGDYGDGA